MRELDDDLYLEITRLSEEGNVLDDAGQPAAAMQKFMAALALLPDPAGEWEAATWLHASIGDMHFKLEDFEATRRAFLLASQGPGGMDNPFIHLRLGQAAFELGDLDAAADELTLAYRSEGLDIFDAEDPKYVEFLETRIET